MGTENEFFSTGKIERIPQIKSSEKQITRNEKYTNSYHVRAIQLTPTLANLR